MKNNNLLKISQDLGNDFDLPYYIYTKVKTDTNEKVSAPLKIGLKLTNACHFRCPYCFVYKDNDYVDFDNLKLIFQKLPQLPFEVYLTGGEAILHPQFSEIVDYLTNLGILVKLHTTGVINMQSRNYILNNLSKFSSIQISIDSIKNFDKLRPNIIDKDPLERIISFVKQCKEKKYKNLLVNTVISSLNVNELDEIMEFCLCHNLFKVQLSTIFTTSKRLLVSDEIYAKHYNQIITKYSKKGLCFQNSPFCHPWSYAIKHNLKYDSPMYCPAQKTEFEIDMQGNVYPCPFLHDETHKMGNLLSDTFDEVWNSGVKELNKASWSENKKCKSCALFKDCGGSCYALAYVSQLNYDKRCILHEN